MFLFYYSGVAVVREGDDVPIDSVFLDAWG